MQEHTSSAKRDAALAYSLLRVTLGVNILLHGISRWHAGIPAFAGSLVAMFAKAPLPGWSVHAFGFALPPLESLIGAAILLGVQTRVALVAGMLLMLVLTFGSTLLQQWQVVGLQLIYSIVYATLLATARFDTYSLSSAVRRSIARRSGR